MMLCFNETDLATEKPRCEFFLDPIPAQVEIRFSF